MRNRRLEPHRRPGRAHGSDRGGDRRGASTLRALTSAALALPGYASTAAADSPPEGISADYSFAHYTEDEISRSDFAGGSRERYEIDIHQFHLSGPIGERFDLGLDLVYEQMSGATPWFILPDGDGEPLQVMTGATIDDARTDVMLSGNYHRDSGKVSLGAGVSVEKDYRALSGSLGWDRHLNGKNTTLSAGLSASVDRIEPTDPDADPFRPEREDKKSYSLYLGASQLLSRTALVQTGVTYKHSRGFLSDPYKQVLVLPIGIVGDRRPERRNQLAWLTRYRQHFPSAAGTLHAEYRLALDDWGVNSHTLELSWYQELLESLQLIPSVRYYSQTEADFYDNYFLIRPADELYSADYRLSGFGALSASLKLEGAFRIGSTRWSLALAAERYVSDGDLALQSVSRANPGLVSFHLYSVRLSSRF